MPPSSSPRSFLLVVVGEFNSGKSAFLNALVGARIMPEGVTPTTSVINLLQYGETQSETMLPDGIIARTFPADFLDEITLVDTPGTNAIVREHEALTQRFVPRADLVLFVTSADRPFTESEHAVHGGHPRVGQEDHDRDQQDRPDPHRRGPNQGRSTS